MNLVIVLPLQMIVLLLRKDMTTRAETTCRPSNAPLGGQYLPQRSSYNPGDSISFSCLPGHMPSGSDNLRICEGDGLWSLKGLIYCDSHEPLRKIRILPEETDNLNSGADAVDGQDSTCFSTNRQVTWTGDLAKEFEVLAVNVHLSYDEVYNFEIFVKSSRSQTSCAWHVDSEKRRKNEWKMFECPEETKGNKIYIKDWTRKNNRFHLCELQVFVKNEIVCNPPMRTVLNGRLLFNRTTALLQCDQNFAPVFNHEGFCEKSGDWNTDGFICERKKNYVLVAVTVSVVLLVVIIVAIVLGVLLKRKRVFHKPTPIENCSSMNSFKASKSEYVREQDISRRSQAVVERCQRMPENDDPEQHEYATVRYSGFLGKVILPIRVRESDSD